MPPQIVLFICIIFVFMLLRIERKHAPEVSRALWIPTVWMLITASRPLAWWFGGATDELSGSSVDRAFLIALFCLGLIILVKRRFRWSDAIRENIWLILFIAYMLISVLWSDVPFTSFKRWIREITAVVMAFLVLTEPSPRQALESLLRRSVYILVPFSALLVRYYGKYGFYFDRWSGNQMWSGVTMQKNGLGRLCMISTIFLIWSLLRRWRGRDISGSRNQTHYEVVVLIINLWLQRGPPLEFPVTANIAFAVGLITFIGLRWVKRHRINLGANALTAIIALGIAFGIVTVWNNGSNIAGITEYFSRDDTLTGRTEFWGPLLEAAMERPVEGYGFGSFWTPANEVGYNISDAHNGYLDTVLEIGCIGLLLASIFLLSSCRKAQKELRYDFDWGSLCICYLIMFVIHNVAESTLSSFTNQLWAIVMFMSVSFTATISSRKVYSTKMMSYNGT